MLDKKQRIVAEILLKELEKQNKVKHKEPLNKDQLEMKEYLNNEFLKDKKSSS